MSQKIGKKLVQIENFEFEYSPETNILSERKSNNKHSDKYVTAVDIFLKIESKDDDFIDFVT